MSDFRFQDEGSIVLLEPVSVRAKEWVLENIPDDAQYFGNAVVIERCYAPDILDGIKSDGLEVL